MTKQPWDADRELDAERVRAVLAGRWPELPLGDVRYLAEGWDSQVFEVDGTWVFRFPKRVEVERDFAMEAALLPDLSAHLAERGAGVKIPVFEFQGEACELFPYRYVGYRKLPGVQAAAVDAATVSADRFAGQLACALSALHAFPADRARALGVPADLASRRLAVMRERALHHLPKLAAPLGAELLAAVRQALEDTRPAEFAGEPVMVHNDLLDEHLLLEAGTHDLTGIIDWSDAGLGDPAVDFVGAQSWGGPALAERVIAAYRGVLDGGVPERVRYRTLCVGVFTATYALSTGIEGQMRYSRAVMRNGLVVPVPGETGDPGERLPALR